MDDADLLRRYVENADQGAFATLVERRLPLVYSAVLRQVGGDAHLARDIALRTRTERGGAIAKDAVLTFRLIEGRWRLVVPREIAEGAVAAAAKATPARR